LRVAHPMFAPPVVITGPDFRFFAERQAKEVGVEARVVLEPMRRDSAPAVAADHVIAEAEAFRNVCETGREAALQGNIVTFGIKPTGPKTSYGYILPGEKMGNADVHKVARFVEKPDAATAERYLREGYLWNSGNFLFRADVLLAEMKRFAPAIVDAAQKSIRDATKDLDFLRLDPKGFAAAP